MKEEDRESAIKIYPHTINLTTNTMPSSSSENNCVSIRTLVRKSKRSIDPEFDVCCETLVSFIEGTKKKNSKDGPSLLLTPIPTTINNNLSSSQRSISRQRSSNNAPLKRRNRSFASSNGGGSSCTALNNNNHPTLPQSVETTTNNSVARKRSTISDVASELSVGELSMEGSEGGNHNNDEEGESGNGMVDISLEDNPQQGGGEVIEGNNNSEVVNISNSHPLLKQQQQQQVNNTKPPGLPRYSSPINVIRTGSGVSSANGGGSVTSDTYLSSSIRSLSSRSQSARSRSARSSRSRSRSRGGHLRMRSLGASNAFSSAQSTGSAAAGGGEGEELVDGEGNEQQQQQPITIPLKDILSVDEEIPSRKRGGSQGSDFYSSAASDVETAKVDNQTSTPKTTNGGHSFRSPSPPPLPTNSSNKVSHRIFLRTLSHGYVEFSLENENSHDIFMAYLKAHLPSDRIPRRLNANNGGGGGGSNAGNSSGSMKHHHHRGASGLLQTMVLSPTKEVPSNLSSSSTLSQRDSTSNAASTTNQQQKDDTFDSSTKIVLTPRSRPKLVSRDSSSVSVCSNKIDKLHSKIINQRIQSESTPLQRIKEGVASWVSSVMDCACCQDTSVDTPNLDTSLSHGSETPDLRRTKNKNKARSPNSEALRNRGIGGLSFEVETAPTPKLSFEPSS